MFYTLFQVECADNFSSTNVCTVRDAYRVVYMLARGESLTGLGGPSMSSDAILMVFLFLLFFCLFCVGLLVTLFLAATHLDLDKLSMIYFWEPKLASHFSTRDLGFPDIPSNGSDGFYYKLDQVWNLLMISISGDKARQRKHWEAASGSSSNVGPWYMWLVAVIALPLWLVLGALTLGLLWPSQIRGAIFRPSKLGHKAKSSSEHASSELSKLRQELFHLKTMSYHKSSEAEREMHDLLQSLAKTE